MDHVLLLCLRACNVLMFSAAFFLCAALPVPLDASAGGRLFVLIMPVVIAFERSFITNDMI